MSNVELSTPPVVKPKPAEAARTAAAAAVPAPRPVSWTWLALVVVVLAVAYGPLLWLFFYQQWQKPQYQYFPFVIAAFAWLLWQRHSESTPNAEGVRVPRAFDGLLQVVACLGLVFGIAIRSPWCAIVSLIVLVAATFLTMSRSRRVVNLWGIWIVLWLMVPVPMNIDGRLTQLMQRVSSRLSSFVLDWFGTHHLMDGNTLWLGSKQLFVDEACSGIISMLSIVACAVIYAVVKNRTPLHLCALAASGIAWAAIFNVARISIIAIALDRWDIDWSRGTPHEMLSLVLFLFAFSALLSSDQVLAVCLRPMLPSSELQGREMGVGRWLAAAWDRLVAWGEPGAGAVSTGSPQAVSTGSPQAVSAGSPQAVSDFGELSRGAGSPQAVSAGGGPRSLPARGMPISPRLLLVLFVPAAVFQSVILAYAFRYEPHRQPVVQRALDLASEDMPGSLLGLTKAGFEAVQRSRDNIHGMYSRAYTYRAEDGTTYMLSFDFPFAGSWHELTECYAAGGWERMERRVWNDAAGDEWPYVEADFTKPGGEFGTVYFAEFDQFGTNFKPQQDWLREQGSYWESRNLYLQERQLFQVQVWFAGSSMPTEEQREAGRRLLLAAREALRSKVLSPTAAAGEGSAASAGEDAPIADGTPVEEVTSIADDVSAEDAGP